MARYRIQFITRVDGIENTQEFDGGDTPEELCKIALELLSNKMTYHHAKVTYKEDNSLVAIWPASDEEFAISMFTSPEKTRGGITFHAPA